VLRPGDFFGELAIISPGPRNATAIALDPAETLAIHRDQLDELRTRDAAVGQVIIEALVAEIRRLAVQLVDALYVPVEKRIWRRLLELVRAFESRTSAPTRIPLTQEELAQIVGTTRPTVNRVLKEAEGAGVVRLSRGALEIIDRDAVARFAR
jgi:CRP-like cAMP-binding protein